MTESTWPALIAATEAFLPGEVKGDLDVDVALRERYSDADVKAGVDPRIAAALLAGGEEAAKPFLEDA